MLLFASVVGHAAVVPDRSPEAGPWPKPKPLPPKCAQSSAHGAPRPVRARSAGYAPTAASRSAGLASHHPRVLAVGSVRQQINERTQIFPDFFLHVISYWSA